MTLHTIPEAVTALYAACKTPAEKNQLTRDLKKLFKKYELEFHPTSKHSRLTPQPPTQEGTQPHAQ